MGDRLGKKKLRRYRAMMRKVGMLRDGLGLGVDKGVKKTVALMSLIGFRTTASCEGHLDSHHGTLTPWVDVAVGTERNERRLRALVRAFGEGHYRRKGAHVPEAFQLWLFAFGRRRPPQEMRVQVGPEVFDRVRPDKGRIPVAVRKWLFAKYRAEWRSFERYLWEKYLSRS